MKIGIVGYGYVGQAVHYALHSSLEFAIVDPYKKIKNQKTLEEAKDSDFIFICVGTPMQEDGNVNLDAFNDTIKKLSDYEGIIVIKSTIPYQYIPDEYNIVYNPEFLSQNNHIDDFIYSKHIILGGQINVAQKVEDLYVRNSYIDEANSDVDYIYCSIKEASEFKYLRNIKQAYNVLFWNYVQEVTGNARLHASIMDKMPVGENSQVGMDAQLGFGGACLPKDLSAYNFNNNHNLTQWMLEYNKELQEKSVKLG